MVGPTCQVTCAWVGSTCWHGPIGGCHVTSGCWGGFMLCCHVSAGVWLTADVGCCGCAMWHQLNEEAFYGCAMWHTLRWGRPLVDCHVALWWGPPVSDLYQDGAHLLTWTNKRLSRGPICHLALWWGPPVSDLYQGGAHLLTWTNKRLPRGPIWCCHVAHPLSSSVLYLFCSLHPVCNHCCYYPQVVPRVALIKSQLWINPFNLFYLIWIYFNSSTYSKIMKFSPKIPKFMMNISVIFNSIFTHASLN
jgi:hypothetical protein